MNPVFATIMEAFVQPRGLLMSKQAYIVPVLGRALDRLQPYGLPLLRITAGVVFMAHGYSKIKAGFFGDGLDGLVLAVIFTVLAILGSGGYSVDSKLKKTF